MKNFENFENFIHVKGYKLLIYMINKTITLTALFEADKCFYWAEKNLKLYKNKQNKELQNAIPETQITRNSVIGYKSSYTMDKLNFKCVILYIKLHLVTR